MNLLNVLATLTTKALVILLKHYNDLKLIF